MPRFVSFNINGLRARPHQLEAIRDIIAPDVIGLQETKVHDDAFPLQSVQQLGYHVEFLGKNLIMAWRYYHDKNLFLYKKAFQLIATMRSDDLSMRAMILMANILMYSMVISRKAKIASMKPSFR